MLFQIRKGSTRIIVLVGRLAFKFPRNSMGWRCNQYENKIWKLNRHNVQRREHLCPVLACLLNGAVLIMTRASLLPYDTFPDETWSGWWEYDPSLGEIDSWPGEFKPNDWGILNQRRVLIDYSAPAIYAKKES